MTQISPLHVSLVTTSLPDRYTRVGHSPFTTPGLATSQESQCGHQQQPQVHRNKHIWKGTHEAKQKQKQKQITTTTHYIGTTCRKK
jgi:hypothetical protein